MATMEEAAGFMNSELFGHNSIGVDIDPRELLRQLREGEHPESLARPHEQAQPRGLDSVPAEFFR